RSHRLGHDHPEFFEAKVTELVKRGETAIDTTSGAVSGRLVRFWNGTAVLETARTDAGVESGPDGGPGPGEEPQGEADGHRPDGHVDEEDRPPPQAEHVGLEQETPEDLVDARFPALLDAVVIA
ncbi:MAG: hypothetical protein ACRDZQ_11760, partial [Acidimicrobiales bacterium]